MLVNFGKYLFLSFAQEWMTTHEMAIFDTALTNTHQRTKFLQHLIGSNLAYPSFDSLQATDNYFTWLLLKSIKITTIVLNNYSLRNTLKSNLILHCISLTSFSMCHCWEVNLPTLLYVLKHAVNLTNFEFSDYNHDATELFKCLTVHCLMLQHCKLQRLHKFKSSDISSLLRGCKALQYLDLSGSRAPDFILSNTSMVCPTLKHLDFTWTSHNYTALLTDTAISRLVHSFPNLTALHVHRDKGLTERGLHTLVSNCRSLVDIALAECRNAVTDNSMGDIALYLPGLCKLNINCAESVSDSGITALCTGCTDLTELRIADLPNITVAAFHTVASTLCKLRSVEFSHNRAVDGAFLALSASFRSIQLIDLHKCEIRGEPHGANHRLQIHNNHINTSVHRKERQKSSRFKDEFVSRKENYVSDISLHGVVLRSTGLTTLDPSPLTTRDTLRTFLKLCPELTVLDLTGCYYTVNSSDLLYIGKCCKELASLTLCPFNECIDAALECVLRSNAALTSLSCRNCLLTDQSVLAIARHSSGLRQLDVTNNGNITSSSLISLARQCRQLRAISFESLSGSEEEEAVVESLVLHCKAIHSITCGERRLKELEHSNILIKMLSSL